MLSRFQNIFYFFRGMKFYRVLIFSKYFFPGVFNEIRGVFDQNFSFGKKCPWKCQKIFFPNFFSSDVSSGISEASQIRFFLKFWEKIIQNNFLPKSPKNANFSKKKSEIKKVKFWGKNQNSVIF